MSRYEEFAEQLLRTGDPLQAAMAIGLRGSEAFTAEKEWPNKLEVIAAKQELLEAHGPEYFLPSKFDQARAIWTKAMNTTDPDAYTKLMRLYAEVMGNIAPKVDTKANTNQAAHIVFEMVMPAAQKPVINVTPERLQIEKATA